MPTKQISYTCSNLTQGSNHKNNDEDSNFNVEFDTGDNKHDELLRTFVLNVDEEAYQQLIKGHPQDVSMTHDQFQILKFQGDGTLAPATRKELWHAFDHRDEYYVAYFIAQKGHLKGTFPKSIELHNEVFAWRTISPPRKVK